jgi:hypothetical protein
MREPQSGHRVGEGDFNHFDPFLRRFDELTDRQLEFLARHVPTAPS